MGLVAQWLRQPQKVWLRKALFQIHLWLGIGLGLYILMMSVTGSAIVARREMTRALVAHSVTILPGGRISDERMQEIAQQVWPGYEIQSLIHMRRLRPYGPLPPAGAPLAPSNTDAPVQVTLKRAGEVRMRVFDPYSGKDLGDADPWQLRFLHKVVDLHDNLLGGRTGQRVNGCVAIAVSLLFVTGLIIWWPGSQRWKQSLYVQAGVGWRRQLWQLHSMMGIWIFLLLLLWGLSGIYFAFPAPFQQFAEWIHPPDVDDGVAAYELLGGFVNLHFGRFGGMGVRTTWIVLGLVPAALFITGAILWWNNVVRPRLD